MADNPIVNRTSAIRDAVDDDTPQESSESGKAYIAKMTAAYDRLAELSGNDQYLAWRPKEEQEPDKKIKDEARKMAQKDEEWLGTVKSILAGDAIPERSEVKPLNELVAQVRGKQARKWIELERERDNVKSIQQEVDKLQDVVTRQQS